MENKKKYFFFKNKRTKETLKDKHGETIHWNSDLYTEESMRGEGCEYIDGFCDPECEWELDFIFNY